MPLNLNENGTEFDASTSDVEYFCQNSEDEYFNNIIGCLEDMLLDGEFLKMQNEFLDKYWEEFDDGEENKLSYMNIFQEYQGTIEQFIDVYLHKSIQDFDMDNFIKELLKRKDKLDGEIFEMLFTFTDFLAFKEMVLDYKAMKEGRIADFSSDISITQIPAENDEQ